MIQNEDEILDGTFFIFRAIFAKRSIGDVWQCSEYARLLNILVVLNMSGILNMSFPKYKKVPLRQGSEYSFLEI